MQTRTRYSIDGQTVTHTGIDPWTREPFTRRYWIPTRGGYVYLDATRDGIRPGTLGTQPTDTDGTTWRAVDLADLSEQIRADWRRTLAAYRRA